MNALVGRRVLIVEDEPSIGMLLRAIVTEAGCKVVGPADTSAGAIAIATACHIDAALVDVSLRGEFSFPLAEYLRQRGVPFAFLTGYDADEIPGHLRDRPVLQKPIRYQDILDAIGSLVGERTS